jgi:hypothetical protein
VKVFRRKKRWQRVAGNAAANAIENPAVKTGAAAVAGFTALTAVSAAVSSLRRKSQP